jgi:hypothetical protein
MAPWYYVNLKLQGLFRPGPARAARLRALVSTRLQTRSRQGKAGRDRQCRNMGVGATAPAKPTNESTHTEWQ